MNNTKIRELLARASEALCERPHPEEVRHLVDDLEEAYKSLKENDGKPVVIFDNVQDMSRYDQMRSYVESFVAKRNEPIYDTWACNDAMSVNAWEDAGRIFFDVYGIDTTKPIGSGRIEKE